MPRFRRQLAALAILAVAGACVADESLAPGQGRVSLEEALAELTVPALVLAMASFTGVGGAPAAILPSACSFQPASESFDCAPISGSGEATGATLSQSFTLVSATGAKQPAFDKATTSWLRTSSTIAGTIVATGYTVTLDGHQELTLTGLLANRHTINGSSTTRRALVTDGSSSGQPIVTTVTTKLTNIVLPVAPPGAPVAWPLSGAVEVQSSTDIDYPFPTPAPGPIVSRVIILFSGTSIVDVVITARDGTHVCTANLASEPVGCRY